MTNSLSNMLLLIRKALESVLVIGYILFEEVIWNSFAKPIFDYFKQLKLLDALRQLFLTMNRYLLMMIFVFIFVLTECLGVLSLITFANQQPLLGIVIYTSKIPIAAFTFWLFELTKPQLLSFGWLKTIYELVMKLIDWLVSSAVYKAIKTKIAAFKAKIKQLKLRLKASKVFTVLSKSYRYLKGLFFKQPAP